MDDKPTAELFAQRFELIEQVGSGGMGTVFRAWDQHRERWVALKVLSGNLLSDDEIERFFREAKLLSELHHRGVVGYIDHGRAPEGRPFLVMEWLEGEDLARRLRRGPLPLGEALTLLQHVCSALAVAHEAGVVHRDLKPANLFLRGGRVDDPAILDFGIARRAGDLRPLTAAGSLMGTPEYMSPEQARGEQAVGSPADVFSLGCVLQECLSGSPPFGGGHLSAILARVLAGAPAPLTSPTGGVPKAVAQLVLSMLEKDPFRRPQHAGAVLARLQSLPALAGESHEGPDTRTSLAEEEQCLQCVLVAAPIAAIGEDGTIAPKELRQRATAQAILRAELSRHGALLSVLPDESIVVALGPCQLGIHEYLERGLLCALLVRERCPDTIVAMATGLGRAGWSVPVGEACDRAGQLLRCRMAEPQPEPGQLVLDEASAIVLGSRHALLRLGSCYTWQHRYESNLPCPPLLGPKAQSVGRETELAILDTILGYSLEERVPHAVLVTAPHGLGKSRLRYEFLRRLEQRGQDIVVCGADCQPLSEQTAYGPVGRVLRQLCGIKDWESAASRQQKLFRRMGERLPAAEAQQAAELLAEVCEPAPSDEPGAPLRVTSHAVCQRIERVTEAFLSLLRAECAAHPLLLVLEDLQWADDFSVALVGAALLELTDCPLLVLGTAAHCGTEAPYNPWLGRVHVLPLRPFTSKTSERMARQLLGSAVGTETLARLVEQAAGNPLWMGELTRQVAAGHAEQTPRTILVMLQAYLSRLPALHRQLLRAASVFGMTFWEDGVLALLGLPQDEHVSAQLDTLVQRELLAVHLDRRAPGQRQLRFRHTLLRDAAYSLFTDEDRCLAHRLAGAYLEERGESDLGVLAQHARYGQKLERAAYYARAAEGALNEPERTAARC